jgi:Arf-GAP/SH3 domain/ANK repeat/PH domain-containing protein
VGGWTQLAGVCALKMGNISSRPDDGSALYLKDQTRRMCCVIHFLGGWLTTIARTVSLSSLTISNTRRNVTLNVSPNAFPAARLIAKRSAGDDTPINYIQVASMPCSPEAMLMTSQDPEMSIPSFILNLEDEDDLEFRFSFVTRQGQAQNSQPSPSPVLNASSNVDTVITGLTFAYASNAKELDNLVTRQFHADPNIHKNSNVQLVGDYSTNGSPNIPYDWSWKWRPPKPTEDKGQGWRNSCSFLEYDQRAHRLNTLASFSFWVHRTQPPTNTLLASPGLELVVPPMRHRMPSSQSYQSAASDSEGLGENVNPPSPLIVPSEYSSTVQITSNQAAPTIDIACPRPGDDMSAVEDGPLFRATMKSLEQKTGNMRTQIKKVLKKAEAAQAAQSECNLAMRHFLSALQEASASNASAFKPALDHYFNHIAQQILMYETQNSTLLKNQIIEPLSRLYNLDIKQAEAKKKDFEDESRDYYAYVSRYLGQRQDSLKEKKRAESDNKYQTKRRNYELKRFDYSSFMQDLHGGRKEQELLSQLTKYADGQAKSFLAAAKKVDSLVPQLDALVKEVGEADKEYQLQRSEREEKRRHLERSTASYTEPDATPHATTASNNPPPNSYGSYVSDTELSRADSTGSQLGHSASTRSSVALSPSNSLSHAHSNMTFSTSPGGPMSSPGLNRFKGIRDLEEREIGPSGADRNGSGQQRKEGLLWALSRPGSHIDPKGINKQAWHK